MQILTFSQFAGTRSVNQTVTTQEDELPLMKTNETQQSFGYYQLLWWQSILCLLLFAFGGLCLILFLHHDMSSLFAIWIASVVLPISYAFSPPVFLRNGVRVNSQNPNAATSLFRLDSFRTSRIQLVSIQPRKSFGIGNVRCKLEGRAFRVGDAVEAQWIGDDGWYPGWCPCRLRGIFPNQNE